MVSSPRTTLLSAQDTHWPQLALLYPWPLPWAPGSMMPVLFSGGNWVLIPSSLLKSLSGLHEVPPPNLYPRTWLI